MKKPVAFPLLLTLLFLGLASIPLMAATIFTTGGPQLPSPVGFAPFGPPMPTNPIPAVSYVCPGTSCVVTDIGFWDFNTLHRRPFNPTTVDIVLLSRTAYDFVHGTEFTGVIQQTSPCIQGVTIWCFEVMDFSKNPVVVPGGTNWLTLYGENLSNVETETAWSNSGSLSIVSSTLSQSATTGVITGYPSQLAFEVSGTVIPEPSSMLLLGSGVVGLAGILRRKLTR